jgi:hypothetical protein
MSLQQSEFLPAPVQFFCLASEFAHSTSPVYAWHSVRGLAKFIQLLYFWTAAFLSAPGLL